MTKDQAMHDGATPLYSGGMAVAASRVVSVAIYKIGDAIRKVADTSVDKMSMRHHQNGRIGSSQIAKSSSNDSKLQTLATCDS